jgi:CheY-like chemotaxis protein
MEKTVLVVDDDPFFLDLMNRFLKAKGLNVLSTTDPEKAYQMAEQGRPDLIISLLQGLRGNKVTQHIPLALLTGSDKLGDVEKGFASGACIYLVKPVDWVIAWPKIQQLLGASQQASERASQ